VTCYKDISFDLLYLGKECYTSKVPSSMTDISVESALAVPGSCRAAFSARRTPVCFCLVATIPAEELCIFERPAMPMAVIIRGSGFDADPKHD